MDVDGVRGEQCASAQLDLRAPVIFKSDWSGEERRVSGDFLLDLMMNPK
jgi:hypothetical protein